MIVGRSDPCGSAGFASRALTVHERNGPSPLAGLRDRLSETSGTPGYWRSGNGGSEPRSASGALLEHTLMARQVGVGGPAPRPAHRAVGDAARDRAPHRDKRTQASVTEPHTLGE